jgi:L-threonylcarbamoyladenylate synthase
VLRAGGVVAFPTDTFYGLGADALNADAVRQVFHAKGRDDRRPLPLLIDGPDDVLKVAREFPEGARRLAEKFWPGPLTIVLPARKEVPGEVTAGTGGVGVRVPDHETPRKLVRMLGRPVTGTSANTSGTPPHKTAAAVRADIGARVDMVLSGACGKHEAPSTVIDFTGAAPRVVRAGAISLAKVRKLVPETIGPPAPQGAKQ